MTKRARHCAALPSSCSALHAGAAAVGVEVDFAHAAALDHFGALARRIADQDFVELRTAHLVGVGHGLVPRVAELKGRGVVVPGRNELGTPFHHADAAHLVGYAEPFQQRQIGRQQRLADMKTRVVLLFQQGHLVAAFGEQRRHGRTRRPTADDEYLAVVCLGGNLAGWKQGVLL